MLRVVTYEHCHFEGVAALWREAFPNDAPWNSADIAIPEKLKVQPDLLLVALQSEKVVGSIMAGYDGHRGWISRIAVLQSHRSKGVGRSLIAHAESRLEALGCIKINLQVVTSNKTTTVFYKRMGYSIEPRVSMSKLLQNS